mmetsp:Transcript_1445/g.1964  ORF Transcript_1445/g.1964 Transcript_1445/m.1964 type:complete len:175 (-) Transcript_1445:3-527(-)
MAQAACLKWCSLEISSPSSLQSCCTLFSMARIIAAVVALAVLCKTCFAEVNTTAPTCTGTADPPAATPYCYTGGELGETVMLKVTSYGGGQGTVDVSGSGLQTIDCKGKPFKKDGQTLSGDWTDCVKAPISIKTIQYCSDQNQVVVNCMVGPVPAATPLTSAACPSELIEPVVV